MHFLSQNKTELNNLEIKISFVLYLNLFLNLDFNS